MRKRKLVDGDMEPEGTAQWETSPAPLTRADGPVGTQTLRVDVRDRSEVIGTDTVAALGARVLFYKNTLRRVWKRLRERIRIERIIWKDHDDAIVYHREEVDGLRREIERLRTELATVQCHDIRVLSLCPKCGCDAWRAVCGFCGESSPTERMPIHALLAWCGRAQK